MEKIRNDTKLAVKTREVIHIEFLKNVKRYIKKFRLKFEKDYSVGNTDSENMSKTLT